MEQDNELVTKGAVKEAVKVFLRSYPVSYSDIKRLIDRLPEDVYDPDRKARPDSEIQKAVETIEKYVPKDSQDAENADLLRWVLREKQDTWTDEELLGEK